MTMQSILAGFAASSTVMEFVERLFKTGERANVLVDKANKALTNIQDYENQYALSLTRYTRQATLRSRVYIDEALTDEPAIPNFIRAIHTMYAGLILTALQMNQFVTAGKTVQDFIGTVATEDLQQSYRDVTVDVTQLRGALEALSNNLELDADMATATLIKDKKEQKDSDDAVKKQPSYETKDIQMAPPDIAPLGKLIEVTLTNPDHPEKSGKIMLAVQMVPYLVPSRLAHLFISKDASLSFNQRILQWKTGEIAFWRDLIFQVDRLSQHRQVLKDDPNKVFFDFMAEVAHKDRATITKNLAQNPGSKSHNLANSVMIFSESAITQAKAESGVDLHNPAVRERYFRDTYSMAVAVVDPLYHRITLYLNGIPDVGTYSFAQFERKNDKDGGVDLVKALATFAAGKAPRF